MRNTSVEEEDGKGLDSKVANAAAKIAGRFEKWFTEEGPKMTNYFIPRFKEFDRQYFEIPEPSDQNRDEFVQKFNELKTYFAETYKEWNSYYRRVVAIRESAMEFEKTYPAFKKHTGKKFAVYD